VRESLNVESGLNGGICVPLILFLIALTAGTVEVSESALMIVKLTAEAIGIGVATGLTYGAFTSQHSKRFLESANSLASLYGASAGARGGEI
jgi:NhaP-type Na+/H+ and K+/H+ antiporter